LCDVARHLQTLPIWYQWIWNASGVDLTVEVMLVRLCCRRWYPTEYSAAPAKLGAHRYIVELPSSYHCQSVEYLNLQGVWVPLHLVECCYLLQSLGWSLRFVFTIFNDNPCNIIVCCYVGRDNSVSTKRIWKSFLALLNIKRYHQL